MKRTLNYIFAERPKSQQSRRHIRRGTRVKNAKTSVRWLVLIVAELLSFTVGRSFDVRAVRNWFPFENNGKTKRTLNNMFAERQNQNRVVDASA